MIGTPIPRPTPRPIFASVFSALDEAVEAGFEELDVIGLEGIVARVLAETVDIDVEDENKSVDDVVDELAGMEAVVTLRASVMLK